MPRTADHTARRAQIAEALVRVAAHEGLHAVSMRSVAAEAGVSLRLVQYYFHTKSGLLIGALHHLEQQSRQRWADRLRHLPDPPPPRTFVETFLAEALPTDGPSRTFHLVGTSYAMLALTDPELAAQPFAAGIDRLEHELTNTLTRARDQGELAPGVDPQLEATRLVMLVNGLGTSMLAGHRSTEYATRVLHDQLDRIFRTTTS
ncbi:TetR/AcrR family transcriptional regulator [Nocardia brasiliensis]|uniref:TetR/AcrR family transcriptional regulator n=1 Tax=Nocardia brasiliensis TaxID=37326 RepID=UPI0024570300|nr:TetR/AcrR family transcriptional regulator [Nocardia brasiliensis]